MFAKMLSPRIIAQTGEKCTASVILLHGSGGTGEDMRDAFHWFLGEELKFPHIRVIYPTAPARPYTLASGMPMHVWFDRHTLGLDAKEVVDTVDHMAKQLGQLVDEEVSSGISPHRILIGGFSMGGCMALHLGYRLWPQLAGVLAMSSFLNDDSQVYKNLESRDPSVRLPPLQQFHGEDDQLVMYDWGRATHSRLKSLGVEGDFVSIPGLPHFMNKYMAQSARDWIAKMLPEQPSS